MPASSLDSLRLREGLARVLAEFRSRNGRLGAITGLGCLGVTVVASRQILELRRKAEEAEKVVEPTQRHRARPPAVNALFLERLIFLLRIVVPSWHCEEALMIGTQTLMLVSRSLLSLRMARLGGLGLRAVVQRSWPDFGTALVDFFISGAAASVVNASLKYLSNSITVSFRRRLTRAVHARYMSNRMYYRAAVLRVGGLDGADARVAEDLATWCSEVSQLYTRTFKPALDVILTTRRLAATSGYAGLLTLYGYFAASGALVRRLSPPVPKLVARQAALEAEFRRGHSRLIAHAEEVALMDGGAREEELLNDSLGAVCDFSTRLHLLQYRQAIADQWALKYFASCVGWPILAVPFLLARGGGGGGGGGGVAPSAADVAARYKENDSLMQGAASSLGDLLLVYKKLQRLAGYTARVVELLEAVDAQEAAAAAEAAAGSACLRHADAQEVVFDGVSVAAPDGRLLLAGLTLTLARGSSLIITGPNGAGKTSIFRVLGGLWAPAAGTITRPRPSAHAGALLFYLPQRPYLVSGTRGCTLRDQVTYPSHYYGDNADGALDARVADCLRLAGVLRLAETAAGLDLTHGEWDDVLSGGEKQRLALARLFFHRPAFAVLDESTSAVNPDEEAGLFRAIEAQGITMLSIAHRMELRRYHQRQLTFLADGAGGWELTDLANVCEAEPEARAGPELPPD